MNPIYPPGPSAVPADLTKPTAGYKQKAWFAMAGLALFVLLYLCLSGWFLRQAWRLMSGAIRGGDGVGPFLVGLASAFLACFMLKAIFFVKHGGQIDDLEVTAEDEPQLFAFLHRLADEAGAPRPHRVFLSGRVNASVFYDLSIVNLVWPSRKNLEIGLALVNALNVSEFKAVLAHEFGHFAQRSMAVGRWVYIAQQIAGHIVAKRDALDKFLQGLSRLDIRIAWVGWLLSLIVWSIRSVLDTVFRLVLLAQRALSREMEMQADLVAVSLTGSDALVHALHRLPAADEAWDRSLAFVNGELKEGRLAPDFFAVQTRVLEHLRVVRNDPSFGLEPPRPPAQPESHRVFSADMAQPPQMWSTHPMNHERENNAKRTYLSAPEDPRSAWEVFQDAPSLAARMSAHMAKDVRDAKPVTTEEALAALDAQFEVEYLKRAYRGIYLGRSVVRVAAKASDLYESAGALSLEAFSALYPESLGPDLERLRTLEKEKTLLHSLQKGTMAATDGMIRHRGEQISRREIPQALGVVVQEIAELESRLYAHDRRCRSLHRAAAASLGKGWEPYLVGLAAVLHYADHSLANLRDAHGAYASVVAVEAATGKVSKSGATNIIAWANTLHSVINGIHMHRDRLQLDATVLAGLKVESWSEALGKIDLPSASLQNINQWAKVIDGWVQAIGGRLGALRDAALAQLLESEARVAAAYRDGGIAEEAPAPSEVSGGYAVLLPGSEREREGKLGWWARFQIADGPLALTARLVAAGGIIAVVLGFGARTGEATVTVYNGLGRPLIVSIDGKSAPVEAYGSTALDVDADGRGKVEARTREGQIVEAFKAPLDGSLSHYVYNVAAAGPLVEWTATYGNRSPVPERRKGATRWETCVVDVYFSEPPHDISSKDGGGTRTVLTGLGDRSPQEVLGELHDADAQSRLTLAHARWDGPRSPYVLHWLALASKLPEYPSLIAARLKDHPHEVASLRAEQDGSTGEAHKRVVARHAEMARQAPDQPDLQYVAARGMEDRAARDQAFLDGERRWPTHPWFCLAAAYVHAQVSDWPAALKGFERARMQEPAVGDIVSLEIARIRRMQGHPDLSDLTAHSYTVRAFAAMESGQGMDQSPLSAYVDLNQGHLDAALRKAKPEPELRDRMLRLVAGSDGAEPSAIQAAFDLPQGRGLDGDSACVMLALGLKRHADTSAFRKVVLESAREEEGATLLALVDALAAGQAPSALEPRLGTLTLEGRGKAYAMGVILLGRQAPPAWREGARRLLFAPERPYFAR